MLVRTIEIFRHFAFQACAGGRPDSADPRHIFCLSESDSSNAIPVTSSPPRTSHSPQLRVEGMDEDGVDVTWDAPEEIGDEPIVVRDHFCLL